MASEVSATQRFLDLDDLSGELLPAASEVPLDEEFTEEQWEVELASLRAQWAAARAIEQEIE